jgi:predicted transcriptional regulator
MSRAEIKMTRYKIQTLKSLREEMKAVAQRQRPVPVDAAKPSFNSAEAMVRLLPPENRELLAAKRPSLRSRRSSSRLIPAPKKTT